MDYFTSPRYIALSKNDTQFKSDEATEMAVVPKTSNLNTNLIDHPSHSRARERQTSCLTLTKDGTRIACAYEDNT